MYWNVKIGSKEIVVSLPEGVPAGMPFRAEIEGKVYSVSFDPVRSSLTLAPVVSSPSSARPCEDWFHIRRANVSRLDGESERIVDLEFGGGGLPRTLTVKAQTQPFVPGIAHTSKHSSAKAAVLRSPMAGKLLKILVTVGQKVVAGQPLAIVEAMKMENKILAVAASTIGVIRVQEGAAVSVNQELIRFVQD